MKVFLTGGTGFIGRAVGEALAAVGHEISGLAHHQRAQRAFAERGWTAVTGDLRDPGAWVATAAGCDAVIHAASVGGHEAGPVDTAAARALMGALDGSGHRFVYTGGIWVLGSGEFDEDVDLRDCRPAAKSAWRQTLVPEILGSVGRGMTPVVVRPGIVYGRGGGIPGELAREEVPVVGDGSQRWPVVGLHDLADLYQRALEVPGGTVLHAVSSHMTMAEVAGRVREEAGVEGRPRGLPLEAARRELGNYADALALDQLVHSGKTRALTGWTPAESFHLG